MTVFESFLRGQQAAQQAGLNRLRLAQMQSLAPIEQQLQQLALERGRFQQRQAEQMAPVQMEAAQLGLTGERQKQRIAGSRIASEEFSLAREKASTLRDIAQSALNVYDENPQLAQTIIAGGSARFDLGIEDPASVSKEDLSAFIAQGSDLDQQIKMQSVISRQNEQGLRLREVALSEAKFERGKGALSAGLEKSLLQTQDDTRQAMQAANEYDVLAGDFERADIPAGVAASFSETLKEILGSEDDVTEFRRRFNKVRLSEGLKNLPPGPATDRDVIEAFKGVPKENASKEQVISFLKGSARLARIDAAYNMFKSDYISNNATAKGLAKEWRASVTSPKLGREVTTLEIYEAAVNKGVTPEEVRERLGI